MTTAVFGLAEVFELFAFENFSKTPGFWQKCSIAADHKVSISELSAMSVVHKCTSKLLTANMNTTTRLNMRFHTRNYGSSNGNTLHKQINPWSSKTNIRIQKFNYHDRRPLPAVFASFIFLVLSIFCEIKAQTRDPRFYSRPGVNDYNWPNPGDPDYRTYIFNDRRYGHYLPNGYGSNYPGRNSPGQYPQGMPNEERFRFGPLFVICWKKSRIPTVQQCKNEKCRSIELFMLISTMPKLFGACEK
ncbi:PREDICTED: uncharacterized protein LOC108356299 isoform X5 [Rhagoletis zephyria]|uniref:uncharacterized protein LOC108356299 isoform X3 n=1 Tax=Rhagoletis zephyria TaxID=28612 RepID=UPI0008117CBE|nr:PREDICTED: uncharacterized protein LOC108356299 isoform X3 [Rhagoletis zephyria]XP_017462928.1 PREDICTED: uncharacterized protein LOC108356299 isoform X4 [Rhagoletis zephyria]XP_017462933.1 PREDICTED: uncharacterized protein LOC108356299 isoform X5 [Rhagoletis zephyria]